MDWKNLTDKLTPYIDKAKEYGKKAVEFTEDQLQQHTPLFIRTQAEYDALLLEKRSIIIGYDNSQVAIADEVRLRSSVWVTRAFMDAATLKFISINEYPDIARHIGLEGPMDMRVRYVGQETYRYRDIDAVKKWWENTSYTQKTDIETENTSNTPANPVTLAAPVDPMASK